MNSLSHKIRYARRAKNLPQKALGKKLGLSEMAISAYETGRAVPPWPTLKRISDVTSFPLSYFTEEAKEQITLEELHREVVKIRKEVSKVVKLLSSKK